MNNNLKFEELLRKDFAERFEDNVTVKSIYKKLQYGTATYNEANRFAKEVGEMLSMTFKNHVDAEQINDITLNVIGGMLNQNVELVSSICNEVQRNLIATTGKGINPIEPDRVRTQNRIDGIVKDFNEKRSILLLEQTTETLSLSMVDEWVKTNAEFNHKIGLSPVIVRVWDGTWGSHDTKHSDWCSSVQGTYSYPVKDKRVFQRHVGCQCIVSYYPDKDSKGKITALAKGEKDTDLVLWNTGGIQTARQNVRIENALEILEKKWGNTTSDGIQPQFTQLKPKVMADKLMEDYESYRKRFLGNAVPLTVDTKENLRKLFSVDLKTINSEYTSNILETLGKLNSRFYSPIMEIKTLDAMQSLGNRAFAISNHQWEYGKASIFLNPMKINSKGIERLRELADDGYSVLFPKGKELEYLITHEYAHTIINIGEKLPSASRNFLKTNFDAYKKARKEFHKVYEKYVSEIERLQKAYDSISKPVNNRFIIEGIPPTKEERKLIAKAAENLKRVKISKYSLTNEDEFIAECFADVRCGVSPSKYSREVYSIYVKYFGK